MSTTLPVISGRRRLPCRGANHAASFVIGTKGYLVRSSAGSNSAQVHEYDPVADTWTTRAAFGGGARQGLRGFAINGKGYAGMGYTGSMFMSDLWEYDPVADTWTAQAPILGNGRNRPGAFALGNAGYVMGGTASGSGANSQLWQFTPPGLMSVLPEAAPRFTCWPNPTTGALHIASPHAVTAQLYDAQGRLVRTLSLPAGQTTVDLSGLTAGTYVLRAGAVTRRLVVR